MTVLPFRNNPLNVSAPHASFAWRPEGKLVFHSLSGRRPNPIKADYLDYGPSRVARFFVGLSVQGRETYSLEHLIALVREYLRKKGMKQDSSFISQLGVYTHQKGKKKGHVVQENSAQVVIIAGETPEKKFEKTVTGLGEHICRFMKQESVIVDYQVNGISTHIWEIIP